MKLLVHHHAVIHRDSAGGLWLPAFIGRWADALAAHVGELRLLLHESAARNPQRQDYRLTAPNIRVVSLGEPGRGWDRFSRMRRIKAACLRARDGIDGLLIRGVTPRQESVARWVDAPHSAFLLVGTLGEIPNASRTGWVRYYEAVMRWHRGREVGRIAQRAAMFANSPGLVAELETRFRCAAHFVPTNTISEREFSALEVRPLQRPARLLFCARVVRDKGIEEAIDAAGLLNGGGRPCVLEVVGPVEAGLKMEMEARARQRGAVVEFRGPMPFGPALFAAYRRADIFVLPTYHEGFPHVLWEAAAHCCPIVTCGVGGIPALLKSGEHALLVEPRNAEVVRRAIQILMDDNELRSAMIARAHSHAKKFAVEESARQLVQRLSNSWRIASNT